MHAIPNMVVGCPPLTRRLHSPGQIGLRKSQRFWMEPLGRQEFAIGKGTDVLLSLRCAVAANIYNLLHRNIVRKTVRDEDFNCHTAAAIALGENKKIAWGSAQYRGQPMYIEEALEELPLPCGMQIHDSDECREVVHSAVLLGTAIDGSPLAFHKNGSLPIEFCDVHEIVACYRTFHHYYGPLTFYEPEPKKR